MERVITRTKSFELFTAQNDSFPFSAESSFRELDDVFLQTQTSIWLGEVLKTRLDEEMSIGDLLADGVLLSSVSQVIQKMFLTKFMKLRSSNAFLCETTSGKNRGRYMPYSNIDSFLKICQILGLTGVDLFSPSDVVEKKDTRKVCMCIRSLSKKAILKRLNVPDFDVVTSTVTMPTYKVEGIRKSLELSQCKQSEDSSSCGTYHDSGHKYGQKTWGAAFAGQYDSFSEGSDDTDSDYQITEFNSPSYTTSCGGVSLLHSDVDNSPRRNSLSAENYHFRPYIVPTDDQDDNQDEINSCSCSPSPEAKASFNAYHGPNNINHHSGFKYPIAETLHMGAVRRAVNTLEGEILRITPVNFFRIPVYYDKSERNAICQQGTSDLFDCGSGSESDESAEYSEHGRKLFEEIEDGDVSSTTFSDLEQEDSVDFVDRFEVKDASCNLDAQVGEHLTGVEWHIPVDKSMPDTDKLQIHIFMEDDDSSKLLQPEEYQLRKISSESRDPQGAYNEIIGDSSIQASGNHLCITAHMACEDYEELPGFSENLAKEKTEDEVVEKDGGASDHRRQRNKLLKSFAGGISLFGVFFLLLHLRRPMETSAPPVEIKKRTKDNISGKNREQKGGSERVYPSDNLRFKH